MGEMKLPWRVENAPSWQGNICTILDFEDMQLIPDVAIPGSVMSDRYSFICLAVNHHDKLVEAIAMYDAAAEKFIGKVESGRAFSKETYSDLVAALTSSTAALADVEKEVQGG